MLLCMNRWPLFHEARDDIVKTHNASKIGPGQCEDEHDGYNEVIAGNTSQERCRMAKTRLDPTLVRTIRSASTAKHHLG